MSMIGHEDKQDDVICPITNNTITEMEVPVFIPSVVPKKSGYWAEFEAISLWLQSHSTCPLSRRHLTLHELRASRDLIFLLDTSHSMARPAVSNHMQMTLSAEKIQAAQAMRSLDLSAYMLLFFLKSLPKCYCTFTVIVFCKSARILCKRKLLTNTNIRDCEQKLRELHPGATTNWQDPILMALKEAALSQQSNKIDTTILLLTDGEPTEKQTTTFAEIKHAALGLVNVQFSAFIYGDEANVGLPLINEISRIINRPGHGGLFFVPSPLEMFDIKTSVPVQWIFNYMQKSICHTMHPDISTYIHLLTNIIDTCKPKQSYSSFHVMEEDIQRAKSIIKDFRSTFPSIIIDPCVDEALSFMNTWGLPALYTLRSQHELKYTANVFDPSTQIYQVQNDDLRQQIQKQLEGFTVSGQICGIPAELSTNTITTHSNFNTYSNPPVALTQIYVADGCVTGHTIFYSDCGPISVSDLVKNNGGMILTNPGKYAHIQHIICREIPRDKKILILGESQIGITEWHPVMKINQNTSHWMFPNECDHTLMKDCDKSGSHEDTQLVYSFVFVPDENGIRASTIWTPSHYIAAAGHGMVSPKKNPVIGHPYWGAGILDDIAKITESVCVLLN